MKIGLEVDKIIQGKRYPAGCVIDLFEPDAKALIASGEGKPVPDGTMARKKAYGVTGCVPRAAQQPHSAENAENGKNSNTQKK